MRISPKQLAQTLYDLTEDKNKADIEKSVAYFARYIYMNRKLKLVDKIAEQFGKIWNQKNSIVEASVATRKKLEERELKKVKNFVKEKYHAKEIVLENIADESIKGGMVLRVGDEVFDDSVAGKLAELKRILKS